MRAFDAVLIVSFGGPQGPADVRPFLENVLRGRRVAPGRIDEVAHHYDLFGGVSPLTPLTMRQADGLRERLTARGMALPVYVGMRNWHPFLTDTLAEMSSAGVRRAIGLIAAAHRSYSSCTQYKENVDRARAELRQRGLADVEITYVTDWYTRDGFIEANAARVRDAIATLPPAAHDRAELVFTAHSIPVSMADRYPYRRQFEETARLVAARVNASRAPDLALDHAAVYQSRSGRPEDPWLGPDVCDYLRGMQSRRATAAVLSPAGFLVDHVEVLYDLDVEAAAVAQEIGLPIARAGTVGDHPLFLDMLADVVQSTADRYARGVPLQVVALQS
jgi:protoporphyrin/coproporphyrin ferrochelatase